MLCHINCVLSTIRTRSAFKIIFSFDIAMLFKLISCFARGIFARAEICAQIKFYLRSRTCQTNVAVPQKKIYGARK